MVSVVSGPAIQLFFRSLIFSPKLFWPESNLKLQRLHRPLFLLMSMSSLALVQGFLINGIIPVDLATLEKRYRFLGLNCLSVEGFAQLKILAEQLGVGSAGLIVRHGGPGRPPPRGPLRRPWPQRPLARPRHDPLRSRSVLFSSPFAGNLELIDRS